MLNAWMKEFTAELSDPLGGVVAVLVFDEPVEVFVFEPPPMARPK